MRGLFPKKWRDWLAWPAIALLLSGFLQIPALNGLDRLDLDLLHALRAALPVRAAASNAVAVVAIDEATYRAPGFAGLPKVMWTPQIATVQDNILNAGATAFGWDIILPTSASTYVADKRFDLPLMKSLSQWGRGERKVLLGDVSVGADVIAPYRAFVLAVGGAANLRSLNLPLDGDGVARDLPGFVDVRGADGRLLRVPGMAGELAGRALGHVIALPPADAALNFPVDPAAIPVYSFADLAACADADYLVRNFKDKVVLFGAVLDIEDRKLAANRFAAPADFAGAPVGCDGKTPPVGRADRSLYPGVLIHAVGVDNLIRGTYLLPSAPATGVVLTLTLALLTTLLAIRFGTWGSAAATFGFALAWIALTSLAFRAGTWLPLIDGWLALGLGWSGGFLYRFWTMDRERAMVRASFSRYLDQNLIEDIIDRGAVPDLGGERHEMTVFFSDIADFSSLSEHMSPSQLVGFLNIYFEIISQEIKHHGGIIERFMGDAVVALFGAPIADPNHAPNAVACALAINVELEASQERFGLPGGKRVATRFGINSGDMVVGNVGAENRFIYTVIGDAVNLAARLESGGKQFGTSILVGETTRDLCGEAIIFRNVDKVRVVGRDNPVELFEPLGMSEQTPPTLHDLKNTYEAALAHIRAQAFAPARTALEDLAAGGDAVSAKMLERLLLIETDPPGPDWDGVINLTRK